MKSVEHRAVGDTAAAGALLHVAGTSADDSLVLSVGDVVALSGDFFASHPGTDHRDEDSHEQQEGLAPDDLFELAGIAGQRGAQPSTRDEIVCALKVLAVDGGFVDARFEPGGQFSDFQFTPTAAMTEVERRARDRFWPWPPPMGTTAATITSHCASASSTGFSPIATVTACVPDRDVSVGIPYCWFMMSSYPPVAHC
jgi:hypothetical protein